MMMKQVTLNGRALVKPSARPAPRLVRASASVESKDVAAPAPAAAGPEVQVTFQLAKHVEFGQSICIIGDSEALGSWNTKKSVSLDWSDGDVWKAACQLPAGSAFEYKYIIRSGERVVWQPCENLTAVVPESASTVQFVDDWAGKARSIDCGDGPTEVAPVPVAAVAVAETTAAPAEVPAEEKAAAAVEPLLSTSSTDIAADSLLEHAMEQELAKTSIESLPVDKLKDLLQQHGLSAKGRKEQMVQRLKAAQEMAGPMPNNGRTKSAAKS